MARREAVWGTDGRIKLYFASSDGTLKEPLYTSVYRIGGNESVTVDSISLDHLFRRDRIDHCDFLKMDREGAEYAILFGASDRTEEWHRKTGYILADKLCR